MLQIALDPIDTSPRFLVNRTREQEWLARRLRTYLALNEEVTYTGQCFAVLGEKGIGKTILVRAVLDSIKRNTPRETIFLLADCRRVRSRRDVLTEIAQEVVRRLAQSSAIAPSPQLDALLDSARVLRVLCNFDADAELKVVHEHMLQFKAAAGLSGDRQFLSNLKLNFGVSVDLSERRVKELVGKVRFDEQRLVGLFVDFFRDVRTAGIHVVLHLDNIDELRHEHYQEDSVRKQVRRDVDSILALRDAPIALVLGLRTYYSGSLPREVTQRLPLLKLQGNDLTDLLVKRADPKEDADVLARLKREFSNPPLAEPLGRLAAMARTPLAFLQWAQALFDQPNEKLDSVIERFLASHCSNVPLHTLRRISSAFVEPNQPVPKAKLLDCCDSNQSLFNQLLDCQVVLPMDFFHPEDFTLDPELDALFWLSKSFSTAPLISQG